MCRVCFSSLTVLVGWQDPAHKNCLTFSCIRQVAPICPHVTHASFGLPESATQMASRLVQPFLCSSWQSVIHTNCRQKFSFGASSGWELLTCDHMANVCWDGVGGRCLSSVSVFFMRLLFDWSRSWCWVMSVCLSVSVCCSSVLFHNSYLNKWCVPFPGPDRSVVYRSEYFKWQHNKQRPVCVMISDLSLQSLFFLL